MADDGLTIEEVGVVLGLTSEGLRKARRQRERGERRWGESYNSGSMDRREALLESIYVKLGGDPKRINERIHTSINGGTS